MGLYRVNVFLYISGNKCFHMMFQCALIARLTAYFVRYSLKYAIIILYLNLLGFVLLSHCVDECIQRILLV